MRVVLVLLVAGLVTGCIRTSTDPVTGAVDLDVESPTKQGEDWKARLESASYPGIAGEALARVYNGQTEVTVVLTGAPTSIAYPWHVHEGTCGSGGGIVGDPAAYGLLRAGSDGRASGNAKLAGTLDEAKRYHVNVHASPSAMGTIIACGNLSD